MEQSVIPGVQVTPLQKMATGKGMVRHALKKSDPGFCGFGEAYFSEVEYLEIKGWKKHHTMTMNLVVVSGAVKFVLYEEASRLFNEFILSPDHYFRLTVPPGLWMAFKGLHPEINLVLNIASIEHDPQEVSKCDLQAIEYAKW